MYWRKEYNREGTRSEEVQELPLQVRRVRKELAMATLDKNVREVNVPRDAAK